MTRLTVARQTQFQIQRFRPDHDALLDSWLELHALAAGSPDTGPVPCAEDLVGSVRYPPPNSTMTDWVATSGTSVVGWMRLVIPNSGTALTMVGPVVRPDVRGNQVATQLLSWCFAQAGQLGMTEVHGSFTADSLTDGAPAARRLLASAGGEVVAHGSNQRLELTAPLPATPPLPGGHCFVRWGSVIPDDHVVAASALETTSGAGELPSFAECADPHRRAESYLRQFEVMRIGRGRRAYQTGVLGPDGALVGFSSLSMTAGEPRYALQGMTVVHESARGHRLGLALKLANLEHARAHEPELAVLTTGNDAGNTPMLATNRAMGYRAVNTEVFFRVGLCD